VTVCSKKITTVPQCHDDTVTTVSLHHVDTECCRCGKCRHYMKFVQAKPSRLHCASCDDTYSLPQNGNIKLYKEIRCPLDHFELVLWTTGVHGKVTITALTYK